jgi:signal transduction histidine kinase
MRPIARVLEIAGTIGPRTLNLRLPERKLPADALSIVQSVNGALERLHRADETQREFLRRAAHHLRTPLMVLSARAHSLDDSETVAELRVDVSELSRTISQLLQLNEIDALPGAGEVVADLGAIGEAVCDELAARAAALDKCIELERPGAPVLVRGDPNVIEIAVRNLAENAIRHSPPGSTIGLRIGTDAHLEVVDAGPGIADEVRDRIFEPFWSGDPHGVSAGLGLTIVNRVAERYGARVSVTAAPGGGARFALHFQPALVRLSDVDLATARASIPASLAHRRRRKTLDRAAG